ncbi:MAG: GNAT family N-acetyltransferase [Pseudohongiellaceae bacterium]
MTDFASEPRTKDEKETEVLSIELIDRMTDFGMLKDEWNELVGQRSSKSLFLTWEWLYTWWKHLRDDRKLFIVLVRMNQRLIAVAPLAVRPMRFRRLLPGRVLEFLGSGQVGSDYLALILRSGFEKQGIKAICSCIGQQKLPLEFNRVESNSAQNSALRAELETRGWQTFSTTVERCPYIRFDGKSWEDYLATLGSSHRYNFRRRLRNLERDFKFRFEKATDPRRCEQFLNQLVELHNLRWRERGGSDALNTQDLVDFHHDMSQLALSNGWLRLYVITLDGNAVAALYGFQIDRIFYFYQSGIDPAYSRYSVGLVIMGLAIQAAIADGATQYDFLHGEENYKFQWADECRDLVRLDCFPPHIAGAIFRQIVQLRWGIKRLYHRCPGMTHSVK